MSGYNPEKISIEDIEDSLNTFYAKMRCLMGIFEMLRSDMSFAVDSAYNLALMSKFGGDIPESYEPRIRQEHEQNFNEINLTILAMGGIYVPTQSVKHPEMKVLEIIGASNHESGERIYTAASQLYGSKQIQARDVPEWALLSASVTSSIRQNRENPYPNTTNPPSYM